MKLKTFYKLVAISCYISGTLFLQVVSGSAIDQLNRDIFVDYNKLMPPLEDGKTKVSLDMALRLDQIPEIKLKQEILASNIRLEQTWLDSKLQWKPEFYGGIQVVHVAAENIWTPNLKVFDSNYGDNKLTLKTAARIYSNGTVVWKPPTIFRSNCEIDYRFYLPKIRTCYLKITSQFDAQIETLAIKSGIQIQARNNLPKLAHEEHVEWRLKDVATFYNDVYQESSRIVFCEKMLSYSVNIILPVALLSFMAALAFSLPLNSDIGEKVNELIVILCDIFVIFVYDIIPSSVTTNSIPTNGRYLPYATALIVFALALTISVHFHVRILLRQLRHRRR